MEQIINQLVRNFDFALMVVINVVTFAIIKAVDELNGDKVPTTWQKRAIFVAAAVAVALLYSFTTDISVNVIINSCIVAPVAWSWLGKPIASRLGIDYKQGTAAGQKEQDTKKDKQPNN